MFVPFLLSPYFPLLMEKLRKNIIRLIVILLVCSGFGMSLVQPVQARYSSDAFANWLSAMAKNAGSSDLQHELDDLRKSGDHLDQIIKKASHLVKKNNENFSFSHADRLASGQLYQLLLIEWNQYQTGNGMSSVPVTQVTKSVVTNKVQESVILGGVLPGPAKDHTKPFSVGLIDLSGIAYKPAIIPMVGGIAIGAP